MIIEFKVQNFRSIYEPVVFSMVATKAKSNATTKDNIFNPANYKLNLLKSAIIYGANASGKTNIVRAFALLANLIENSTNFKLEQSLPYEPFRLNLKAINEPTVFEIDFIAIDKIRYKYGLAYNQKEINEEYLYAYPKIQERKIFHRKKGERIEFGSSFKGDKKTLEEQLLNNNLLLSKAANSNYQQFKDIYLYFSQNLAVFLEYDFLDYSMKKSEEDANFKNKITEFLKVADTGIDSFNISTKDKGKINFMDDDIVDDKGQLKRSYELKADIIHYRNDDTNKSNPVRWDISEESSGTFKLFALAGPIIEILKKGHTFVFDEINNSLHPMISKFIINLFNNPATNPNNAQLIITSHDTTLLDKDMFRRDQIWFTEKTPSGSTDLYSLSDFDKAEVRKDTNFNNWYLTGRFGALPLIGDFKI